MANKALEKYKNELPENAVDRFNKIMEDLFVKNNVPDDMRIPIFCGVTATGMNGNMHIRDIYSISGYPIANTPYDSKYRFAVPINHKYNEKKKVVFTLRINNSIWKLFSVDKLFFFQELGLEEDADFDIVYGRFCEQIQLHGINLEELIGYDTDIKNRTDALDQHISEYKRKITELETALDSSVSYVARMNGIDEKIISQKKELESIERNASELIDKKIEDLEGVQKEYLNALDKKIENYETILNSLKNDISSDLMPVIEANKRHEYIAMSETTISANQIEALKQKMKYDYDKDTVIRFLTALHTSQIIVLCGKPGIGKTTFAGQMALALGAEFHLIEVQNNWTDRSDILGYYNPTNDTYQSTDFLDAILWAEQDKDRLHFICLDEMNLARVEYYFATFLSMLQRPKKERVLKLLPKDKEDAVNYVKVKMLKKEKCSKEEKDLVKSFGKYCTRPFPSNIHFIGTMNIDDSTNMLSPKVLDRSFFIELNKNAKETKDYIDQDLAEIVEYYSVASFMQDEEIPISLQRIFDFEIDSNTRANPRLQKYAKQMWKSYCQYSGIDLPEDIKKFNDKKAIQDFLNILVISKVLPACTKKSYFRNYWEKELGGDNSIAVKRFKRFLVEHENDRFVTNDDHWSFWE